MTKPLDLQSSATSEGSSIASLPLPETNSIPGGGSESSGLPLRNDSRPESGEEEEDEEEEDEEVVEEGATSPRRIVLECGRTRGTDALKFGVTARDVKADAGRIVVKQRSAPRSATIARRRGLSLLSFSLLARSTSDASLSLLLLLLFTFYLFPLLRASLHLLTHARGRLPSEDHCVRASGSETERERVGEREREEKDMLNGEEAMPAATTAAAAAVPSSHHVQPLPGSVLSEAATSLLASNKAKRRALGASLESLLATFSGNAAPGDAAPPPSSSSSLPLDPRFAPLVRRARAQRAALFALSRGVPLSAGLMAAVDGVEVVEVGVDGSSSSSNGRGEGEGGEPYFYSEPVSFFCFFLRVDAENESVFVLWEEVGGRGATEKAINQQSSPSFHPFRSPSIPTSPSS